MMLFTSGTTVSQARPSVLNRIGGLFSRSEPDVFMNINPTLSRSEIMLHHQLQHLKMKNPVTTAITRFPVIPIMGITPLISSQQEAFGSQLHIENEELSGLIPGRIMASPNKYVYFCVY